LASLAARFEENRGQFDARVRYLARAPGYRLFLTADSVTLALAHGAGRQAGVARMRMVGARAVEPIAEDRLAGSTSYYVGSDRSAWREGVEGFARVRYPSVLPGVDVVYYGGGDHGVEYDVVIAPGIEPKSIALAFDGARGIRIGADGEAHVTLSNGDEVVQRAPVAYQLDGAGRRHAVDVRFTLANSELGFAVGAFDAARSLVIDPPLTFSTYLGGSGSDGVYGVAVDSAGEIVVVGTTSSTDFPVVGAVQGAFPGGSYDAFVTKLNAAGTAIVYSTYLGGSSGAFVSGVALDSSGDAFVTGATSSSNFPTASALQPTFKGVVDAFLTKLGPSGALVYSTYLGGSGNDWGKAVAVDGAGSAYLAGFTFSTNFPTVSPLQAANRASGGTAFVTKVNAAGNVIVYSTYLGGSTGDAANTLAVDASGDAFVAGNTSSTDFPTLSALQGTAGGGQDAFVSEIKPSGSALVYSTYLGGSGDDMANGVALDGAGDAFVVGDTASSNFPTVQATQHYGGGARDAFVGKIGASGLSLLYSTYLGGSDDDHGASVAVDASGRAYVVGDTASIDFPLVLPSQSASGGKRDAFVSALSAAGTGLLFTTYLGGGDNDLGNAVTLDGRGDTIVAGETASTNLPIVSPLRAANAGGDDAYVSVFAALPAAAVPALGSKASFLAALILLVGLALAGKSISTPRAIRS
jgi:hypothetical protein